MTWSALFYDIKGCNPTKGADRHKRVCGQPLSAAQHITKAARAYPSTFRDPALLDTGRIDPCFKAVEVDFHVRFPLSKITGQHPIWKEVPK
jgi:hypothetical protein